ncbi:F0F1 ATP synthase subunit gamma [Oceanidesulfovibrio marinus]|uniref:ATP synthase gamma chain n=1 Tax=Oceanidesulfovibrio marinus TaxID=370038 RepID=A0A6P1ZK43_9BACT|nr:F0F1 ATP synthase subunit gamma [Oceanidesulfovibrio marinus]QJT09937.1 F0F1 ATP synthase subunit gamma [Oceanidesulfovibrio marinus]TVM35946.1 ATP synthase F1 subunit gamma [Oceanidesulfovibrio marinus]
MASLRDIQNKISAVKKTKQITKAMNMVASAKLRKAQQSIERFRPYAEKFYEMLGDMASKVDETAHPLLAKRDEIKTVGIIVMTSDRGLCGSFNANQNKTALRLAEEKKAEGKEVVFYAVGKRARDRIRKTDFKCAAEYADQMTSFDFSFANTVATEVIEAYLSGELDEVIMIFGEFISMARQQPNILPILPIQPAEAGAEEGEAAPGSTTEYIYEPDVKGLLAELLPRFIKVMVYRGMLDTSASEHAARMAAMDNATKACDDMVGNLTLVYNKTRQATITKELMDIVGGAEALKG